MLEMRAACERCAAELPTDSEDALICSYECTFCRACAAAMEVTCPNCAGVLVTRPTRLPRAH